MSSEPMKNFEEAGHNSERDRDEKEQKKYASKGTATKNEEVVDKMVQRGRSRRTECGHHETESMGSRRTGNSRGQKKGMHSAVFQP